MSVSYIDRIRFPARRNKFLHIYYRLRERICRQRFTLHLQQILPGESGITGGSGLGLSIVKGYIDIHKGQVEASNVTGKGANIFIRIPSMLPLIENF